MASFVRADSADACRCVAAIARGSPLSYWPRLRRVPSPLTTTSGIAGGCRRLLFHLDKDLTIALQLQRADLFFLHAAVVALDDRAVVLSAPSGTGKSTLALALLENGFDYLSDELAPIDVQRLTVHPFPHALCLKSPPPAPYCLPTGALGIGVRYHVPGDILRG
jgi:hypothetical protein